MIDQTVAGNGCCDGKAGVGARSVVRIEPTCETDRTSCHDITHGMNSTHSFCHKEDREHRSATYALGALPFKSEIPTGKV